LRGYYQRLKNLTEFCGELTYRLVWWGLDIAQRLWIQYREDFQKSPTKQNWPEFDFLPPHIQNFRIWSPLRSFVDQDASHHKC
jgi:hypothetical protein